VTSAQLPHRLALGAVAIRRKGVARRIALSSVRAEPAGAARRIGAAEPSEARPIARRFVREFPADRDDVAIVSAILAMARSLGLTLVALGVETLEQADLLRSIGCDELQGDLRAQPAAAEFAEHWLAAEKDALV
jgi:hypothetical protein